jgi:hypothetical protein
MRFREEKKEKEINEEEIIQNTAQGIQRARDRLFGAFQLQRKR